MKQRFVELYLDVAKRCAEMSYATRAHVGAVIVKNGNIVSFSWNGTPSGWDNNCEHLVDGNLVTKDEVIHAEENAIYKLAKAGLSGDGASMFITHEPCIRCAKGIAQAGIREVWYEQSYTNKDPGGVRFLEKSGITVTKVDRNDWV